MVHPQGSSGRIRRPRLWLVPTILLYTSTSICSSGSSMKRTVWGFPTMTPRWMVASSRRSSASTNNSNSLRWKKSTRSTSSASNHSSSPPTQPSMHSSLWTTVLQRAEQTLATTQQPLPENDDDDDDASPQKEGTGPTTTTSCNSPDPSTTTTAHVSTSSAATATTALSLMANALERAEHTLSRRSFEERSTSDDEKKNEENAVDPSSTAHASHRFVPFDTATVDSSSTTTSATSCNAESTTTTGTTTTSPPPPISGHDEDSNNNNNNIDAVSLSYGQNPTITSTALAHLLWSYVLRPGMDSAIDATAGNGSDTLVLAKLLFPATTNHRTKNNRSQILAVDVQEMACQKTRLRLAKFLAKSDQSPHNDGVVQVVCASHAPLPLPPDTSNIALVVYNLGYLPNHKSPTTTTTTTTTTTATTATTTAPPPRVKTQTETTLASLADAALALRVGGLLSVMTYPRSNAIEDAVVRAFLEGLALFSSQTRSYTEYVQSLEDGIVNESMRERLRLTLDHVREEGGRQQTWRVHEHKKLGWVDAPILLTATRIK